MVIMPFEVMNLCFILRYLWAQERFRIFSKGLTARMTASSIYSLAIILGYESVKKISVLPEYKVKYFRIIC